MIKVIKIVIKFLLLSIIIYKIYFKSHYVISELSLRKQEFYLMCYMKMYIVITHQIFIRIIVVMTHHQFFLRIIMMTTPQNDCIKVHLI